MKRAGAPHAAHDLVEDQEHAIAVADLAYAPEIARRRRDRTGGGTDHSLSDESHHSLGSEFEDFQLELIRSPAAVGLGAFTGLGITEGEAGIDEMGFEEER